MALKDYTREKTSFRKVSVFYNGPGRRGNELRMRVSIFSVMLFNSIHVVASLRERDNRARKTTMNTRLTVHVQLCAKTKYMYIQM